MKGKDIVKNLLAIFALLNTGLSASVAIFYYFEDTLPFVREAELPETPTAYVLGGFLGAVFGILFSIFLFFFFLILILCLRRKVRLSYLLFQKGEGKAQWFFRGLGFLTVAGLVCAGIQDWIHYKIFFINGLWYYASCIAFVLLCTMLWIAVLTKETVHEKNMCI